MGGFGRLGQQTGFEISWSERPDGGGSRLDSISLDICTESKYTHVHAWNVPLLQRRRPTTQTHTHARATTSLSHHEPASGSANNNVFNERFATFLMHVGRYESWRSANMWQQPAEREMRSKYHIATDATQSAPDAGGYARSNSRKLHPVGMKLSVCGAPFGSVRCARDDHGHSSSSARTRAPRIRFSLAPAARTPGRVCRAGQTHDVRPHTLRQHRACPLSHTWRGGLIETGQPQ